jgi:hypothetical protein
MSERKGRQKNLGQKDSQLTANACWPFFALDFFAFSAHFFSLVVSVCICVVRGKAACHVDQPTADDQISIFLPFLVLFKNRFLFLRTLNSTDFDFAHTMDVVLLRAG